MIRSKQTRGIVLHRINYGEADRILTILTPDHGKLRVIAKGVRKIKSKLAGGIELFSVSDISFLPGKGDVSTLVSTRLIKHYSQIVKDLDRTTLGYEFMKLIDKNTQDTCEEEFYTLIDGGLDSLNSKVDPLLIESWFYAQLLKLLGHQPNLDTDANQQKLSEGQQYGFDFDHMAFMAQPRGIYNEKHIKIMRLLMTQPPKKLRNVENIGQPLGACRNLLKTLMQKTL